MTDMSNTSSNEEPTRADNLEIPEPAAQSLEEAPAIAAPVVAEEMTLTMSTGVSLDEMDTAVQSTPQAESAPVYEHFEHFGVSAETVQSVPYPAVVPVTPDVVQPQAANPAAFYPQGAYAPFPGQLFPGQPGGAQVPVKKKRSKLLWVAIVVLVALLLGGGSALAYAFTQSHAQAPSPNSTLQTYCQGVKTGNAQQIYDLLSQQARVHTSLDDLQKTFTEFNAMSAVGMDAKYTDCTFTNLRVSGSLAVATVSLTLTLSMTLQGQTQTISVSTPSLVSLVLEDNQWKVDFSSLTQPQPNVTLPNFPSSFLTPTVSQ